MAKSQQTFNKLEREKNKAKKREEKSELRKTYKNEKDMIFEKFDNIKKVMFLKILKTLVPVS